MTVARSYFEQLINNHNISFADQLFDSAVIFRDPTIPGESITGLAAVKAFFTVFPDVNFTIEDLFVDG